MPEIITEVHTITSALGWYFNAGNSEVARILGNTEPVLCFALLSSINTDYPSLAPTRKIIALDENQMDDLVGSALGPRHTDIAFGSNGGSAA